MIRFIKIHLLDTLFGWYLAFTIHRMLWYHVVMNESPPLFAWGDLLYYLIVGIAFSALCSILRVSLARKLIDTTQYESWRHAFTVHISWLLLLMTFVTGWILTRINLVDMFSGERLGAAQKIFQNLMTPDFGDTTLITNALTAIVETIYLAFIATALALPLAFVLGFLSARNLMRSNRIAFAIYYFIRIATNFTRSVEPLVWAVIFSVWVKVGPFPGMLALLVHTVASLAKQYSEQIEDTDAGPVEAITATGARPLQVIWFAIVPQVFIPFLSFTIYRWDINVRMATVIGLVGGGGIGTMLVQYQMLADWKSVGMIVLVIATVVWIMDYLSARIREALQ